MADVFISYHVASAAGVVRQIAEQLRKRGVTYWHSEGDMKPGFDFAQVAPQEIEDCKVFLLILDEGAVNSIHVGTELALAFDRIHEISIIPFRVQACPLKGRMRYYLKLIQIMNNRLTPPLDKRIAELADYIAQLLGKEQKADKPPRVQPPTPLVRETARAQTPSALWTPPAALWTRETISAGWRHTVGLRKGGSVVAVGDNEYGQCDVTAWRDIVALSAGSSHTVGLRRDGAVVAVGNNGWGQCDVTAWRDIVALSAGDLHTAGLRRDGAVFAVGSNSKGQCNVETWQDIVALAAGWRHTVGLRKEGAVFAVGDNGYGQCNVSKWRDIVALSAGRRHTVGLRKDGAVFAVGDNNNGQCNVTKWRDIATVSAGEYHTVGLRKDSAVVSVGNNAWEQCDVSDWRDIQLP